MAKHSLYKWQEDCLAVWQENRCQGIVNVVTGGGKTFLACAAIELLQNRMRGLRVRIVVPTIPLAEQWNQALLSYFGEELREEPGFYYGAVKDSTDLSCLIYVVNTARHCLSWHIRQDLAHGHSVLLICDECHHYTSRENRRIFDFVTPGILAGGQYFSLGLSATPFAGENPEVLQEAIGPEIFRYQVTDAVRASAVAPFMICTIAASFLPGEALEYGSASEAVSFAYGRLMDACSFLKSMGPTARMKAIRKMAAEADMDPEDPAAAFLLALYRRKEISVLARARIQCVEELIGSFRDRKRILVFSERIEQARKLYIRLCELYPHGVGIYHSEMSAQARDESLGGFRKGHIRILVACRCLDEGLDVPDADIGIVMSSSAVERQRIQRLGRIIRRKPGGQYAILYYLYIYNSHDDAAYLPGLELDPAAVPQYYLRYYSADHLFSNPALEDAGLALLEEFGKRLAETSDKEGKKRREALKNEIRNCLLEGMTSPDYLLPEKKLLELINEAKSCDLHRTNYYRIQLELQRRLKRLRDPFS